MSMLRFTKDHEWVKVDGDEATVGITDYAQSQLGDVVYVELPDVGRSVTAGGEAAVFDSVTAASEIYAPLTGEVSAVNDALADSPSTVNDDAEGSGWFMKIKFSDKGELDELMDEAAYKAFVEEQ